MLVFMWLLAYNIEIRRGYAAGYIVIRNGNSYQD